MPTYRGNGGAYVYVGMGCLRIGGMGVPTYTGEIPTMPTYRGNGGARGVPTYRGNGVPTYRGNGGCLRIGGMGDAYV